MKKFCSYERFLRVGSAFLRLLIIEGIFFDNQLLLLAEVKTMDRPDIVDHSPRELVRRAGNLSAAQATKLAHRSPVQMRRAFTKYGPSKRVSASVMRTILIVFGIACGVPT